MNSTAGYLTWIKLALIMTGTAITTFLGGWDIALQVLVIFVVADYLTGLVAAWVKKKLDSNIGFRGIAKKVLLFVPVAIGYWLDQAIGQEIFRSLAIWFYIVNEGLSVLENVGRAGVPIPEALRDALAQLQKKGERTNTNN